MARCRICHRPMSNPDHIAAGMGPVCAAKAARQADDRTAVYPRDRYDRILRGLEKLAGMLAQANAYDVWARAEGTATERAEAAWLKSLISHWYARAQRMEQHARRLLHRAA